MSVIFGLHRSRDRHLLQQELEKLACATARFSLHGTTLLVQDLIGMAIQPYSTNLEDTSVRSFQPIQDHMGNIGAFDGRLDNRQQLCQQLGLDQSSVSDAVVILAAFEQWGEGLFSRLTGEWALAIWSGPDRKLYLARDHAGTRSLYFSLSAGALYWSTYLETFLATELTFFVEDQYLARYIAWLPTCDLTPYRGIFAVPAAHFVVIGDGQIRREMHWDPSRIPLNRLKRQEEYDEHFLTLFEQAVARRLSGATTLLAHLSGGMDSTANVCMADYIVRSRRLGARDYIDTLSFFDNSEPHWDEQPFFLAVEALRGKKGIHFDAGHSKRTFAPIDSTKAFYLFPGADGSTLNHEIALENALAGHDYKAILSGIGGDEILGGNPSYQPELADHLMAGRFITLIRNSFRWSLHKRRPLLHTLFDATVYSARAYFAASTQAVLPPWFSERTRSIFRHSHKDFHYGTRSIGIRPSAIGNAQSWVALQEALPNLQPGFLVRREYRYPYLDRDLAEFCFSIPPEQHVQPGRRRALMRRALRGIVPDIILERRRKAYIARAPWVRLRTHSDDIRQLLERSELVASGYVDRKGFIQAVDETIKGGTRHGEHFVIRALEVELWLRSKQASSPRQAIRDDKLTVLSEQSSTRSL